MARGALYPRTPLCRCARLGVPATCLCAYIGNIPGVLHQARVIATSHHGPLAGVVHALSCDLVGERPPEAMPSR